MNAELAATIIQIGMIVFASIACIALIIFFIKDKRPLYLCAALWCPIIIILMLTDDSTIRSILSKVQIVLLLLMVYFMFGQGMFGNWRKKKNEEDLEPEEDPSETPDENDAADASIVHQPGKDEPPNDSCPKEAEDPKDGPPSDETP